MTTRSLRNVVKAPFFSFVESISELGIYVASRSSEMEFLSCFKWLRLFFFFTFSKKSKLHIGSTPSIIVQSGVNLPRLPLQLKNTLQKHVLPRGSLQENGIVTLTHSLQWPPDMGVNTGYTVRAYGRHVEALNVRPYYKKKI